jgi:hypothetical protein
MAATATKQQKPAARILPMPSVEFVPGDRVYARWFGDDVLTVQGVAKVDSSFPHYICSLGRSKFVISKLHLSTQRIIPETKDSNRRQLRLPI